MSEPIRCCCARTSTRRSRFYEALGFRRSYLQVRPSPYAVVALEDMTIHLCGIDGFDPQTSVGSAIIVSLLL